MDRTTPPEASERAERGTALAEWALVVVLIAIVALVGVALAGDEVSGQYSVIASEMESANG